MATDAFKDSFEGYADEDQLLGAHAVQVITWASVIGGLLAYAAYSGRLEDRMSTADVALLGITTHKIARIVTRGEVTNFQARYGGAHGLSPVHRGMDRRRPQVRTGLRSTVHSSDRGHVRRPDYLGPAPRCLREGHRAGFVNDRYRLKYGRGLDSRAFVVVPENGPCQNTGCESGLRGGLRHPHSCERLA